MFKSSRFISLLIAVVMFVVMVYTTEYEPIVLATSISTIVGMYIIPRSFRGANKENNTNTVI